MTVPRLLEEIYPAWEQAPPVHRALASVLGMFGVKRRSSHAPIAAAPADETSEDLLHALGAAGVQSAPLPPELLAMVR